MGILATAVLVAGCGGRAATPHGALRAYARAVERGDAERAWAMHAPAAQATMDRARFEATVADAAQRERRRAEAARLRQAAERPATLQARVLLDDVDAVTLAYVGGDWRVTGGVATLGRQQTPRDAIVRFVRAIESGEAAALLPLVPRAHRARLTDDALGTWLRDDAAALAETAALLKASLDTTASVVGDTATFRYGTRTMTLQREDGLWVIADFE